MMRIHYSILLLGTLIFASCKNRTASDQQTLAQQREFILATIKPPKIATNEFVLTDFGGIGDTVSDNKQAFDRALSLVKEENGGRIIVPPGTYLVNGPIHLVSNTTLDIQRGARIIFGTNAKDYLPAVPTSWEGTFIHNYSPLIYAYQAENIAIIGEGIIDGNGKDGFSQWYDKQQPAQALSRKMNHEDSPLTDRVFGEGDFLRPHLIQFFECENILLENVTVANSPFWCVHFLQSENITARAVKFDAHNKNNDGFDIEYSRNVLIEDVEFNNADDNVAIKAGRDREGRKIGITSENIIVRNCRFKGLHGIVIGSEMSAGVQQVFVENCTYGGYCKRGIYLKSNPDRGGFIRDIYVNDLAFDTVSDAIFITSFYKGEGHGFETEVDNINFSNISVKHAEQGGVIIQGFPTKKVRNVTLENVRINSCSGTALSMADAEQVVMSDVIIGNEVTVPSSVN